MYLKQHRFVTLKETVQNQNCFKFTSFASCYCKNKTHQILAWYMSSHRLKKVWTLNSLNNPVTHCGSKSSRWPSGMSCLPTPSGSFEQDPPGGSSSSLARLDWSLYSKPKTQINQTKADCLPSLVILRPIALNTEEELEAVNLGYHTLEMLWSNS